jgi:hypothetical protein
MANKYPWFRFYAEDWLTDMNVQTMSLIERGFYLEVLCLIWAENGIPNSQKFLEQLFNRCSTDDRILFEQNYTSVRTDCIDKIKERLTETQDGKKLTHWKLEEIRKEITKVSENNAEKGRKSGESRRKKKAQKTTNNCSTTVQPELNHPDPDPDKERVPPKPPKGGEDPSLVSSPSQKEVREAFEMSGGTQEMADAFWGKHDAMAWHMNGQPIRKWQSLIGPYIARWRQNTAVNGRKPKEEERHHHL